MLTEQKFRLASRLKCYAADRRFGLKLLQPLPIGYSSIKVAEPGKPLRFSSHLVYKLRYMCDSLLVPVGSCHLNFYYRSGQEANGVILDTVFRDPSNGVYRVSHIAKLFTV